jgi:hypothetical protein
MGNVLKFTKAVWNHWGVLLAGAVVVTTLVEAESVAGFPIPAYMPWAAAQGFVLIACYRAWNNERLQESESEVASASSPQVLVHFDCEAEKPKPLALINASDIPAFNVKVHDVQNADYVARFEAVSQILKEWVAVDPRVEGNGGTTADGQNLMTVLQAGSGARRLGSRTFPLRISYTNFQGREFETQYEIDYDLATRRAVARLKPAAARNGAARSRMRQ